MWEEEGLVPDRTGEVTGTVKGKIKKGGGGGGVCVCVDWPPPPGADQRGRGLGVRKCPSPLPFLGTPNSIKGGKTCMCAQMSHVLVVNSYPESTLSLC